MKRIVSFIINPAVFNETMLLLLLFTIQFFKLVLFYITEKNLQCISLFLKKTIVFLLTLVFSFNAFAISNTQANKISNKYNLQINDINFTAEVIKELGDRLEYQLGNHAFVHLDQVIRTENYTQDDIDQINNDNSINIKVKQYFASKKVRRVQGCADFRDIVEELREVLIGDNLGGKAKTITNMLFDILVVTQNNLAPSNINYSVGKNSSICVDMKY
jgi:hypothetical protein